MEKVKKTIEYRQHKSTLDDEEVYHWITVCRTIVHFASTVDENLLKEFCKEHLHKTVDEFSIIEVLMAIGLPTQAYYYGIRVRAEKRKKDQEEEHGRNLEKHRQEQERKRKEEEEKKNLEALLKKLRLEAAAKNAK